MGVIHQQAIPYNKNEANNSIEKIMSGKIEQNKSKTINKNAKEQNEITRNQTAYIPHFKYYLNNIPTPSLSTPLDRYTNK